MADHKTELENLPESNVGIKSDVLAEITQQTEQTVNGWCLRLLEQTLEQDIEQIYNELNFLIATARLFAVSTKTKQILTTVVDKLTTALIQENYFDAAISLIKGMRAISIESELGCNWNTKYRNVAELQRRQTPRHFQEEEAGNATSQAALHSFDDILRHELTRKVVDYHNLYPTLKSIAEIKVNEKNLLEAASYYIKAHDVVKNNILGSENDLHTVELNLAKLHWAFLAKHYQHFLIPQMNFLISRQDPLKNHLALLASVLAVADYYWSEGRHVNALVAYTSILEHFIEYRASISTHPLNEAADILRLTSVSSLMLYKSNDYTKKHLKNSADPLPYLPSNHHEGRLRYGYHESASAYFLSN